MAGELLILKDEPYGPFCPPENVTDTSGQTIVMINARRKRDGYT